MGKNLKIDDDDAPYQNLTKGTKCDIKAMSEDLWKKCPEAYAVLVIHAENRQETYLFLPRKMHETFVRSLDYLQAAYDDRQAELETQNKRR